MQASSQKQGGHTPDTIVYRLGPTEASGRSDPHLTVGLAIELKWVAPSTSDTCYVAADGRTTRLDSGSFKWALHEGVFQTLWYLHCLSQLCGTRLGVAQINEFFYRCLVMPGSVLVLEMKDPDVATSSTSSQDQTIFRERPRRLLSVTEAVEMDDVWRHPPHSLLQASPEGEEALQVHVASVDILSAMIYCGMFFASTDGITIDSHDRSPDRSQLPADLRELPGVRFDSSSDSAARMHEYKDVAKSSRYNRQRKGNKPGGGGNAGDEGGGDVGDGDQSGPRGPGSGGDNGGYGRGDNGGYRGGGNECSGGGGNGGGGDQTGPGDPESRSGNGGPDADQGNRRPGGSSGEVVYHVRPHPR